MGSVRTPPMAHTCHACFGSAAASGAKEAVQEQAHSQNEEEQETGEEAGTHHRRNQEKAPHKLTSGNRSVSQTLGLWMEAFMYSQRTGKGFRTTAPMISSPCAEISGWWWTLPSSRSLALRVRLDAGSSL
jgi:hypothetical protein